mmetsp:Transcript_43781/g.76864  ORF Transcript_43781/g.76864 Transcript_43781/m.76864 type:complete len:807 (+) Transcript_43781:83-2503(+)
MSIAKLISLACRTPFANRTDLAYTNFARSDPVYPSFADVTDPVFTSFEERAGTPVSSFANGFEPTDSSSADETDPVYPNIKHVHVVNSCHLDLGFGNFVEDIVNLYFDHHIPLAVEHGEKLRQGVPGFTDNKLNFMFGSWVLDMYFDCPPGLGLHCPSSEDQQKVRTSIEKGDITWHAFPFDAQFEIMAPALIKAGLELTHALDRQFQQTPKATLAQLDVPGMTRAVIPLLREQGVSAISIGVNEATTPPDLPPCFLWKDPVSSETIPMLFTWPGYGALPLSNQRLCLIEGFDHTLVYNFMFDNAGPMPNAEGYARVWQELSKSFPNAAIYASTFDNFTQHLTEFRDRLPVVEKEIGDSWIYGVPSDPQKVSRMRVINRVYEDLDHMEGIVSALVRDPVLKNATRFALKAGEHTWGKDVKKYLLDNNNWENVQFMQARNSAEHGSEYETLESSWWEQRHWGITVAVDTLKAAGHPLTQKIEQGFAELQPTVPSIGGYELGKAGEVVQCGSVEIAFDETGSISHLVENGFVWADSGHKLLQLKYRSYSAFDMATFFSSYTKINADWVDHDYGKPGLPFDVEGKVLTPFLNTLYLKRDGDFCSFVLHTSFALEGSEKFGAASTAWIALGIGNNGIDVTMGMFNKSATRLPESMFVQFLPAKSYGQWYVNKLDSWVPALEVIDGGAKHLHGNMEGGFRLDAGDRQMLVSSLDAAVVNFGELTAYPSPVHNDPDTENFGASFLLWDNLWGTNYVMWWPFIATPPESYASSGNYFPSNWNDDIVSRFHIAFKSMEQQLQDVQEYVAGNPDG